ncbi:MAG: HlyD family efflux transporter periplasmic adaptor subunit [Candidatus Aminicenantes bacterium]|nr:HlyD family efflux transporter periplasmic adaptor subunit [Candidatus Aminicenantes bacterium]
MKKLIIILICALLVPFCGKRQTAEIKAPGVVDGNIITLKSQVSGVVDEVRLVEGRMVAKDEVLVSINSDKIKNQLDEVGITLKEIENNREKLKNKAVFLKSNLAFLGKQVERFRRLRKSESIPGENLEAMELKKLEAATSLFDIEKTLRDLELQKEKIENKQKYLNLVLADHVIKSPVSQGVIIETFVSVGETVFPGASIADILDLPGLYVETFLEEREVASLKLNMKARILVDGDGQGNKELWGTVSYFGRKAEFSPRYIISEKERESLLYQVKIKVEGDTGIFKIGMPVTVAIKRELE